MLHQGIQGATGGVLEIVRRQADPPQVAFRVSGSVEAEHVHAALVGRIEERMRPGLLERVAAGDVKDQRCGGPIGAEMQIARHQRAVPGDVEMLQMVGRQGDDLVVTAANARIEIAFLGVVLEDGVLGPP
jgi:hypothetical protein